MLNRGCLISISVDFTISFLSVLVAIKKMFQTLKTTFDLIFKTSRDA